jgi:hypothetical protein
MDKRTLSQHIQDDKNELDGGSTSSQRRRHLKNELEQLEIYKKNHPQDEHDPTSLELYCEINPSAAECKIYED